MNYKSLYDERKSNVLAVLKQSIEYYVKLNDDVKVSSLTDLALAVENGTFSIVVVGQFSAGKSTFLNALMGEKYLPSFNSETTATINFLRSVKKSPSGEPLIKINYKDGAVDTNDKVTLENIEKYVSTKGDGVAKKILSVEVFLDSPYLNDGVSLVDSPGLNGLLEGHEQITNEQIDRSHAAIFMFNASQPGSKSDFEKLKMLTDKCDSVLIVLNQKDRINPNEETVDEVVQNVKNNYAKYFNTNVLPEIYAVSSYQALVARSKRKLSYQNRSDFDATERERLLEDSDIETFEGRLIKYLTQGEKAQKELLSPVEKVRSFLNETEASLTMQIEELGKKVDSDDLKLQINALKDELSGLTEKLNRSRSDIRSKVSDILRNAENKIKSGASDARSECIKNISDAEDLEELESNSQLYVNRILNRYIDIWESAKAAAVADYEELIRSEYNEYVSAVEERLNANGGEEERPFASVELDKSMFETDVEIDDFLEQRSKILEQMDDNNGRLDELEMEKLTAERNERKREKMERMKVQIRENKIIDLQMLGARPEPKTYATTETRKTGGIKGFFKWIFTGTRETYVPSTYTDTSAREAYDADKERIEMQSQQELDELNLQLKAIPESQPELYTLKMKQIERAQERAKELLEDLLNEYNQKTEKARKSKERQARSYIDGVIEVLERDNLKKIYEMLRGKRDEMTNALLDVLQAELQSVIARKTEEMELRENQLSSSLDEKEQTIARLSESKNELLRILSEADSCATELKSIVIDKIERS